MFFRMSNMETSKKNNYKGFCKGCIFGQSIKENRIDKFDKNLKAVHKT